MSGLGLSTGNTEVSEMNKELTFSWEETKKIYRKKSKLSSEGDKFEEPSAGKKIGDQGKPPGGAM